MTDDKREAPASYRDDLKSGVLRLPGTKSGNNAVKFRRYAQKSTSVYFSDFLEKTTKTFGGGRYGQRFCLLTLHGNQGCKQKSSDSALPQHFLKPKKIFYGKNASGCDHLNS